MTSGDARGRFLRAVARELRVGTLARRRILRELADHIDDAVDDLHDSGVPREEAVKEAVNRLGDAETIAAEFGALRTRAAGWARLRRRRSLAWIAVAAMSVVTAWAAELPQVSGAQPPARMSAPALGRSAPMHHSTTRHPVRRARPGHGGRGRARQVSR